jgi:hypothetical protein
LVCSEATDVRRQQTSFEDKVSGLMEDMDHRQRNFEDHVQNQLSEIISLLGGQPMVPEDFRDWPTDYELAFRGQGDRGETYQF